MAKSHAVRRKNSYLSLTPLEKTISDLISSLLEEKTAYLKEQNPNIDESDPAELTKVTAFAKDLKYSEILFYSQSKVMRLQREKKVLLEKAIDKTWKLIKSKEEHELSELGIDIHNLGEDGSKDDEKSTQDLVEVKDENKMNKSIVNLWNMAEKKEDQESVNSNTNVNDNDTNGPVETSIADEKNSKKRSKENNKSSKRHKTSSDRSVTPNITLDDLGGMEELKDELYESVIFPMQHPEIYSSLNIQPIRGILFNGPPGCGKTTIANALAGTLQCPFISLSAPSVVSGMSGESEKKIREIFEEAKSLAPCLIFFDEIDAITPKRDGGAQREMERRIVAQLLTSIDELSFENTNGKPVVVLAATNRPDSLDPALRRAGRFEREISVKVPDEKTRFNILKSMTSKMKIDGDLKLMKLAKLTPGYVGADLKALTTTAGIAAIKRIFKEISEADDESEEDKLIGLALENDNMEIDMDNASNLNQKHSQEKKEAGLIPDYNNLSTIKKFLYRHPNPLTKEQLEPLAVKFEDFLTALPNIQPTAKREGFATIPDVDWSHIGALTKIRAELQMSIVQPIKNPEIYEKVGITAPSGVLMWGPPGCGKTLLAKAIANESKANFISIKGPELLNKYVGESEKAIRQVFQRASASIPCIIFFDELDALVPRRDSSLSESSSRVVNTLLTELDGLNGRQQIFVVGATNRPDMIDPAMLRPGRLDKTLYIELPTPEERLEIFKTVITTNKTPLDPMVNLNDIANDERCNNFSGADISSVVREAGVFALKRKFFTRIHTGDENIEGLYEDENGESKFSNESGNEISVTMGDFNAALDSVKPSVSDRDRLKYERLNKRLGWSKTEKPGEDVA
ncbi:hypothetical protein PACTADRAFT_2050 [Pachysolen tannophilus NRRL Y-2460]|uniref:AAA+ ATPase domain-containing protein n=1 Tax=Pachysolen tannophilus NRRL Y-2460 TaxID=669874 RepID=A0A1E4TVH4_PACTA|nr:hypothetical protein PACTADRAFT_2050 [Pachysolen tannophilus NRRL Y-2460]